MRGAAVVLAAAALAVAAFLAAAPAPLAAQQGDTLRLTLDEALSRAVASNPAYRQATNDLDLNRVEAAGDVGVADPAPA